MSTDRTALTRRTFVASAGALGALAACGTAANTLYASAPQAFGDESGDGESIVWRTATSTAEEPACCSATCRTAS